MAHKLGGVYALYRDGELVYIGCSDDILRRLRKHNHDYDAAVFQSHPDMSHAYGVETRLIQELVPPLNRLVVSDPQGELDDLLAGLTDGQIGRMRELLAEKLRDE